MLNNKKETENILINLLKQDEYQYKNNDVVNNIKDLENKLKRKIGIIKMMPNFKLIVTDYDAITVSNGEDQFDIYPYQMKSYQDVYKQLLIGITDLIYYNQEIINEMNKTRNDFIKELIDKEGIIEILRVRYESNRALFKMLLYEPTENKNINVVQKLLESDYTLQFMIITKIKDRLKKLINENNYLQFEKIIMGEPKYACYFKSMYEKSKEEMPIELYVEVFAKGLLNSVINYLKKEQINNKILDTDYILIFENKTKKEYYYKLVDIKEFSGLRNDIYYRFENPKRYDEYRLDLTIDQNVDELLAKGVETNTTVEIELWKYNIHILGRETLD